MSKKDGRYYAPSEYEKYLNSQRVRQNSIFENESYSIHTDEHFYRQIEAENTRYVKRQENSIPQPPVNSVDSKVKQKNTQEYSSVYDKIAQKRKKLKDENYSDVSNVLPSTDNTKHFADIDKLYGEFDVTNEDEMEKAPFSADVVSAVKVGKKIYNNNPITENEAEAFINQLSEVADFDEDSVENEYYTKEDIVGMCEYYRKKYSRKMWITLISSLSFFCIIIVAMYLYMNGYFDIWFM